MEFADSMETALVDGTVVQMMADLKQQDKTLWQKTCDWFKNLVADLKAVTDAYRGHRPDSAEGRMVADMQDVIVILESLYGDALLDAGENYKAAGAQKNTTREDGVKYSFAGSRAESADHSALKKAKQMDERGMSNEDVRQQTGWFKGIDGKWRFEVDDSTAQVTKEISNYMSLGDLLPDAEIFKAYPDMKDISVVFQSLDPGVNAQYNRQFDHIDVSYKLKNDPDGIRGAVLHELQHAIQNREGFTAGATVASWDQRIKNGFDSRKGSDIREAREAEQKLQSFQNEDPVFYSDMMELEGMAPDLPRGAINWDTLEQIEEDPPEWQAYDAKRDELEEIYGDKMWEFNSALYDLQRINKRPVRTAEELYFDTAGEIEARNVSGRRNLTAEQRKNTPPILGGEDTVFAEGATTSADYIGKTADGIEVYETSENTKNLTWAERKKTFLHLMRQQYRGRTAKFIRNGHAYYAKFEYRDVSKNIYGDDKSDSKGRDAKINVGADGNIFELVENSKYSRSETERGKTQRMHRGINHWDYFVKTVQIDGTVFDLTANVRKKTDGEFVYIIEMMENNEIEPSSPQDSQNSGRNGAPNSSTVSIRNPEADVKEKFSLRDPAAEKAAEAVRKENEKLKEDVQRLRDLLKLQRQVTGGTKFTKSSVEAAARYLKQAAGAKGDTKELAQILSSFYEFVATGKDLTWEDVKEQAKSAAQWLQKHVALESGRGEYASEVLRTMRTSRISLDDSQKAEAAYRYGSFNDFRKAAMGAVTVAKDGVPLDIQWQEWADMYPDIFDANTTATGMPSALMEVAQLLRNADLSKAEYAYHADMIEQDLIRQGGLTYLPITNNDPTQKAISKITEEGWDAARYQWHADVRAGKADAEMAAMGALLLNNAAKAGDRKAWLEILADYQIMGTRAAQAVQALRILKTLSPSDKLYMLRKSVQKMVKDLNLESDVVIDDVLIDEYNAAETDEQRDAIITKIQKEVALQLPTTGMEMWTALRYVDMLGNFKTQIRKEKLESLTSDFYISTGVAITLYDAAENVEAKSPVFYGSCACVRTKEACVQSCNRSNWTHMEAAAKQKSAHSYTCNAGRMETITPILYEDAVIAYLQIGQFRDEEQVYSSREKI